MTAVVAGQSGPATASTLKWGACPDGVPQEVACSTLQVPLDYSDPNGRQITLTVSGIGSLSAKHFLLVNPGGPGASGLGTEQMVSAGLPQAVADQYAVFSFDPRGVGLSSPVDCGDLSGLTPHPALPYRAANKAQEAQRISLAKQVAARCGAKAKDLLPHITTENAARDMDRIRIALGRDKIDYLGYSYGSKLGATYATLFPSHTGRMILDSVVDPSVSTYRTAYEQNPALQHRAQQLFSWTAARDSTYHLGRTRSTVETAWRDVHRKLAAKPAGGRAGGAELDDLLASSMYIDVTWGDLMRAVSDYRKGDPSTLLAATDQLASQSVDTGQLAYNCMDPGWPRNWRQWHHDTVASNASAPLFAWLNTWYGAPCAFWPVGPARDVRIGSADVPPILLLQGKDDAATPVIGAVRMRQALKGSRLLIDGGGNHASYLFEKNPCIDRRAEKYLLTGELPPDGLCPAPTPEG
ncbi:alpha/beta hydrolase [Kribbella sp. CA-253562]|uniref:alpha/beta hydrolase n=1 Tax=Kribbella sp. CA-253562 TaxID=3239942 RepID=UPI003D94DCFE